MVLDLKYDKNKPLAQVTGDIISITEHFQFRQVTNYDSC